MHDLEFLRRNLAKSPRMIYFVGLLDSNELLTLRSLTELSLDWWMWMILLRIYGTSIWQLKRRAMSR